MIDARSLISRIEEMTAVLDRPEFVSLHHSLAFVDGLFGFGRVAPPSSGGLSDVAPLSGMSPFGALAPTTRPLANSIIDEAKGKTYVYDAGAFVPDPTATGAPANGVRVVMHGWEPNFESPNQPLTRLGYADFEPLATTSASAEALRARLVRDEGNVALADYTISHGTDGNEEALSVDGWAFDGVTDVRFDAITGAFVTADGRKDFLASTIRAPSRDIGVELRVGSVDGSSNGGTLLTIAYGNHVFTAVFREPTGEVRVDERVYATIAYVRNADGALSRQYEKADGKAFTQQETRELDDLIDAGLTATLRFHDLVWF